MADALVRAVAPDGDLRFVGIRNEATVSTIAKRHGIEGALLRPLGNAVSSAQLLATQLKGMGALTLVIETDGLLRRVEASANPFGLARGMIPQDAIERAKTIKPGLPLIKSGTLSITRQLSTGGQPYRGIVDLASPYIAKSVAYYLEQSEQIRSSVGLSTSFDRSGIVSSGGFMVQVFPGTPLTAIEKVESNLTKLPSMDELFQTTETVEELLRVIAGGFDIEFITSHRPDFFCPCSRERTENSLRSLGKTQLEEFIAEDESLELRCDHCRELYLYTVADLCEIRDALSRGSEEA